MLGLQAICLETCLTTIGKLARLERQANLSQASEEQAKTAGMWSDNLMFGCICVQVALSSMSSGQASVTILEYEGCCLLVWMIFLIATAEKGIFCCTCKVPKEGC